MTDRLLVALVSSALLAACGATSRPIVALPAHGGGGGPDALTAGRLAGDATTGCVWLEGMTGNRTSILWPPGYGARFGPLELVAPDRTVIAHEGDEIALGGAEMERPPAMRCRVSPSVWFATEVSEVNGQRVELVTPVPPARTERPIVR